MPNRTERANARALPETTNRRAFLTAALAAGAVTSLSAVAAARAAPDRHPDADLFALVERAKVANDAWTEANAVAEDLFNKIRANDDREADLEAAEDADERSEALRAEWEDLAKRVGTTPAKTIEGLLAKLALVASAYSEDDICGTHEGILASAALDAQAIKASREARS